MKAVVRTHATLAAAASLIFAGSGCGLMQTLGLANEEVSISRTLPAENDLPTTTTIAISSLDGKQEDAVAISAALGELIAGSGRYQLVERERFEALSQERGCTLADLTCVSAALPATAVIVGSVVAASYSENTKRNSYECTKDEKKTTCVTLTRTGTANSSANLRLVEASSGKVLLQKFVTKRSQQSETGSDGSEPGAIDSFGLLESVRREVAAEFAQAIAPYQRYETVEIEDDGDIPELGKGNDQLEAGQLEDALALYEAGVERAENSSKLEPDVKARAHYNLSIGYAALGRYDEALASLAKALELVEEEDWQDLQGRMTRWKKDATKVAEQLAYAQAQPASVAELQAEQPATTSIITPGAETAAAKAAP
jgi:tetratricopeptide (TPR) repeat protein